MNKIIFYGFFLIVFTGLAESCMKYYCVGRNLEIGCRRIALTQKGKRSTDDGQENSLVTGIDIIIAADDDGDNMLNFEEASHYLHHRNKMNVNMENSDWFSNLDTNSDGLLDAEEKEHVR